MGYFAACRGGAERHLIGHTLNRETKEGEAPGRGAKRSVSPGPVSRILFTGFGRPKWNAAYLVVFSRTLLKTGRGMDYFCIEVQHCSNNRLFALSALCITAVLPDWGCGKMAFDSWLRVLRLFPLSILMSLKCYFQYVSNSDKE